MMEIGYVREFVNQKWGQLPKELVSCAQVIKEKEDVQGQPLLEELLKEIKPGDVLVVRKLYSLANSTKELIDICRNLREKQADAAIRDQQLLFGPLLLKEKNTAFLSKWKEYKQKLERNVSNMQRAQQVDEVKLASFKTELLWLEEELNDR